MLQGVYCMLVTLWKNFQGKFVRCSNRKWWAQVPANPGHSQLTPGRARHAVLSLREPAVAGGGPLGRYLAATKLRVP